MLLAGKKIQKSNAYLRNKIGHLSNSWYFGKYRLREQNQCIVSIPKIAAS